MDFDALRARLAKRDAFNARVTRRAKTTLKFTACQRCGAAYSQTRANRVYCNACRGGAPVERGNPWVGVPGNGARGGRRGKAYYQAVAEVKARAHRGQPCAFHGLPGYESCPGGWDWSLPPNHAYAFTAHHLHRIMDGGAPVPDPAYMVPAHRSCNARDGLTAQNLRRAARRRGVPYVPTSMYTQRDSNAGEHTSRMW